MHNGLNYLNSLGLHKVKPGLERIRNLLASLDNPQDKVPGIIVAGTNGKGSVASAIAAILSEQGFKVGLYTSPHLISIAERIKINSDLISTKELSSIILEIKESAENSLDEMPSYFEVITAAAFLYFARTRVDYNVLEVGMGGRWDATNVINPLASVITNISMDHSEYLGDTIVQIAAEKACVIKPTVPVITGASGEGLKVIEDRANENSSSILIQKRDFCVEGQDTSNFEYKGVGWKIGGLNSNLYGTYQLDNLSLALATIEAISKFHNITVDESSIRNGLQSINWGGRFEIIREDTPLILDGAHNPAAAKALVSSLSNKYPDLSFTFVVAMLDDKEPSAFIKEISTITKELIITNVPSERSSEPDKLAHAAKKYIEKVQIIENYQSAFEAIRNLNKPICVTGSIYLIGAIKNLIQNQYN